MKDTTRSLVIAILAILAVAVAAATIESTVIPDTSGPEGPNGPGEADDGGLLPPPQSGPSPGESIEIPFLSEIVTIVAVLAVIVTLLYLYRHWRTVFKTVVAIALILGLLFVLFEILGPPPVSPPPMPEPGNGNLLGGGGGGGSDTTEQPSLPTVLLLVILLAVLLGTVVALVRTTPDDGESTPDSADADEIDTAAVGEAAGRAADRIEGEGGLENEIFRAWHEMTELLDVSRPETSTPGEFATAAVDAGLGRQDVDELTRLFEDVRYGNLEPTADREQRAIAVFRRIEDRHAEDDS